MAVLPAGAALVGFEAESGTLGGEWLIAAEATALGGGAITISTNIDEGENPASPERIVTYSVNFTEAGDYDLYVRRFAADETGKNDDSLFYASDFGIREPTLPADWVKMNGHAGSGGVYQWLNISANPGSWDAGIGVKFSVRSAGLQTFQIGGREDGHFVDAFAFGTTGETFTDEQLDEAVPKTPASPYLQLGALYESPSGEAVVIDATPAAGFPTEFTYQWCFNGLKIPANLGGTASSINIDNLQANEGTWSVTVTNETGSVEQSFEYRVYVDSDSDGLSDAYEELVSLTNINNSDTDNDGLADGDEVNTYRTNPNSSDSDSDGFTDLYELETAYDPNSAESTPDAQVNIMTAIEVDFNAALGATYEIQFSTDTIEWTVIEAGIVGEGNAVERLYSRKDFPTGFFRVERTDQ